MAVGVTFTNLVTGRATSGIAVGGVMKSDTILIKSGGSYGLAIPGLR